MKVKNSVRIIAPLLSDELLKSLNPVRSDQESYKSLQSYIWRTCTNCTAPIERKLT